MLFDQNEDSGEVDEAEERLGEFVIAGGNTAELLNLLPKSLNQMSFFVFPPVALALYLVGFTAGNIRYSAKRYEPIHKLLAVVPLVGVDNAAFYGKGTQKRRRVADVRFISR